MIFKNTKIKFKALFSDVLFRNSFYLMLSSATMAVFGFMFWLLVAHFYQPEQVGIASTLISSMNFMSYLAMLGFNAAFIRYLPKSKNRNSQIDTGLILVMCAGLIVSGLYVLLAPQFAPRLNILHDNWYYWLPFMILVTGAAVNLVTDSVFIAYRSAKYNFLIDGIIASSIQLSLPILLVSLGSFGIFVASGSAAFSAMVVSLFFLIRKFGYKPQLKIEKATLKEIQGYSFLNYIANLFNILPALLLPLIIIKQLGAASAGYFYLAFTMATLIFTIAYAVSQSMFAEGSYAEQKLIKLVKKSLLIMLAIMIPAALFLAFIGPLILNLFGAKYGLNARSTIIVLAATCPFVATYILGGTVMRITKKVKVLIAMNIVYALTIAGLAYAWASKGLVYVAWAWLIGHALTSVLMMMYFGFVKLRLNHQKSS